MKKYLLALAAMTWATITFAEPSGDIFSIVPLEGSGDTPLVAGEKVRFRVRLLARDLTTEEVGPAAWGRYFIGVGSEQLEDWQNPLMIGIIVSGRLRGAKVVSTTPYKVPVGEVTGYPYTDLECEYTVQPGDIARPVYLALASSTDDNPVRPGEGAETQYFLFNTDRWALRDTSGNICNLSYCGETKGNAARGTPWGDAAAIGPYPAADYDLSAANFNIQSVDFDENKDSENYWREVKKGTTQTTYKPMIKTIGTPETAIRLYVWSENEEAVVPYGDNVSSVTFDLPDGGKRTVKMAEIKVISGKTDYDFQIFGVNTGKEAELVLSPTPGYRFDSVGDKIVNYVTRKVYCSEPPRPNLQVCFDPANPTSTKSLTVDTSMKTVENLADDAKPLYIVLSEPFTNNVTVSLAITNVAKPECNPITNLNIAVEQYGDSFSTMEADRSYTNITIMAGDTFAQVYLYPLGGTADTQSQGIQIIPTILTEDAAEHYEVGQRALYKIRSTHKPTITTPEAGTNYDAQEPTGFSVPVGVADCYRDLNLKGGFKVDVDYSDGSKMTTTNVVFTENGEVPITLSNYGINVTYANIKITEPDGTAYATVKVYFTVKPQKTVSAALYDSTSATAPHVGTTFKEGDTPIVRFTISEKKPAGEVNNLYAFLVPQNEASSNCVECAAFTEGVLIPGGQTESALSVYWKLNLVDGTADTDGSKGQLSYKILLRTRATLDDGSPEESYIDTDGLQFTVANVDTKVDGVMVNGDPDSVEKGQVYSQTVPAESDIPFIVSMTDPSIADQTNGLVSVWIFTSGRTRIGYNYSCVTSKTDTATMRHQFSDPGTTQTVQVVAIDKDLLESLQVELKDEDSLATFWTTYKKNVGADAAFNFKVVVDEAPMIILTPEELSIDENSKQDVLKNQKITVELNNPAPCDLTVRLSLKPYTDDNFGSLKFKAEDAEYDPATGISTLDLDIKKDAVVPTKKPNVYVGGVELEAASLDGVAASMDDGWYLEAKVVTEGADDEYSDGTGAIYVRNMPPVIRPAQSENITTNKQLSVGESYTFTWGVSDVMEDMTNFWSGTTKQGIKCDWYVNDGLQAGYTTYVTNTTDQTTTIQINQEGLTTVKLVATDKDGEDYNGVSERIWYFYIAPTKRLTLTPVGPASNSRTKYATKAKGLGKGRTWTSGTGMTLTAFQQTWNFNISTPSVEVRAYGYASAPEPYEDDGSLGPGDRDAKIGPTGEKPTETSGYYTYDGVYDNYFYRWAFITAGENGGPSTVEYSDLQPTTSPLAETMEPVHLDEYDEKKAAYETRRVEAIFSREMFTSDNLGDINLDYIPDIYTLFYPDFGITTAEGHSSGADDIQSLAQFNEDDDYLPNSINAPYADFVPGLAGTWVTAGMPFNARLEVRGWEDNLNDAPALAGIQNVTPERVYMDPNTCPTSTISYIEYVAFTNWCGRQTEPLNWEDKANWAKWSPERPTDPTKADTDDDGIPDGYEYYFWYKAHVGDLEIYQKKEKKDKEEVVVTITNYIRYVGRRYNPVTPCEPTIITSDEIEAFYDPITPNDELALVDTDNDGLTDLIEYELGTNPFDYDTDRDGLPDGYEVAISQTDPLIAATDKVHLDGELNPDKDAFAKLEIEMYKLYLITTNTDFETTGLFISNVCYAAEQPKLYEYTSSPYPNASNFLEHVAVYAGWHYERRESKGEVSYTDVLGSNIVTKSDSKWGEKMKTLVHVGVEEKPVKIIALHHQVLELRPFHPHTAWNPPPARPFSNTAPYTTYDEFMSLAFYINLGQLSENVARQQLSQGITWEQLWTKFSTNPLNADTDADNMPDGWEFYVSMGCGPEGAWSPLYDFGKVTREELRDPMHSGLDFVQKFCGVDCCAVYADCPTIVNIQPEWRNKKWPCNPFAQDTDGDGLSDGEEHVWFYGDDGMDGGGLNPLSWDTDCDGLPDPWELEFCGTYSDSESSTEIVESTSGEGTNAVTTVSTNTTTTAGVFKGDGMNPTAPDASADYDGDGLLNWQEYMVGAMRCWRYDDTVSTWDNLVFDPNSFSTIFSTDTGGEVEERVLGEILVDYWGYPKPGEGEVRNTNDYNPGCRTGFFDPGAYFSCATNAFEQVPCAGSFYMFKDGIYHDLAPANQVEANELKWTRYTWVDSLEGPGAFATYLVRQPGRTESIYPTRYICCNPCKIDTDQDGMDDFYELFHGLNPILGQSGGWQEGEGFPIDLIFLAYGGGETFPAWDAEHNAYTDAGAAYKKTMLSGPVTKNGIRDFYQYPWLAGINTADPDGDNIRNQQESILSKVQAARTFQHLDPTPLWMTDSSYEHSLTWRYYQADNPSWVITPYPLAHRNSPIFLYKGVEYNLYDFPWLTVLEQNGTFLVKLNYKLLSFFSCLDKMFSFEENEGYDSDHDYLSDFEEQQGRTKSASDPQQHDSPIRHQAMYFDGVNSFCQAPYAKPYPVPIDEAGAELRQNFLSFTVEAWVKVDQANIDDGALHTIIERSVVNGESGPADEKFLRKNFLIGIKSGKWYAKFDSSGTDAGQFVEITDGPEATTNWTHVAISYGPKNGDETVAGGPLALKLYVDGIVRKTIDTSIHPENGSAYINVDETTGEFKVKAEWDPTSLIIGASAIHNYGVVFEHAWENAIDIVGRFTIVDDYRTTFKHYSNFFRGYIDEVRVWDGARSEAEILSDVQNKVRYTSALVDENRQAVYNMWKQGALRSPTSANGLKLPPELIYHFAFDHIAGAADTADMIISPAGFSTEKWVTDAKPLWCRPSGWSSSWWDEINIRSTVFTDRAWMPWINNTVAHLPLLDGTTEDSVYWSENNAAGFPRTAEVNSRVNIAMDKDGYSFDGPRWFSITNGDAKSAYRFARRNRLMIGGDMLPMGGAYPRRISIAEGGMWDTGCAADAWAQTGKDEDNNGLPDWWEEYARKNYAKDLDPWAPFDRSTMVNYYGMRISAGQAYLRDLAKGLLPDGEKHPEFADTRDDDKDGLPDWWEDMYGIQTGSPADADADPDNDGLSNYQEYLISEVYPEKYHLDQYAGVTVPILDPTRARSGLYQQVTDYFLRYSTTSGESVSNEVGKKIFELNEYFGEIVTDDDYMENWWEIATGAAYADATKYDPLSDRDEDGWSNWAECRAALWGGYFSAGLIDKWTGTDSSQHVVCYPEPIIGVKIVYHGVRDVSGQQLVVKTTTGQTPRTDATFVVPATLDGQTRYIGAFNADTVLHGHMSPGLVNANSIVFECARTGSDKIYTWNYNAYSNELDTVLLPTSGTFDDYRHYYALYPKIELQGADLTWEVLAQTVPSTDLASAKLMVNGSTQFGSVNCTTGEYELDMAKFPLAGGAKQYVYRVTYTSRVGHEWPQTVYLSDTRELSNDSGAGGQAALGNGRVREGKNTIEAFFDLDGDGAYTPGEPYGSIRNVQVGWHKVQTVTIELKDESPIMSPVSVGAGGSEGLAKTVRIVRELINEIPAQRVLGTKTVVLDDRPYLTEVDACSSSKPDLDWVWLTKDAVRAGVTTIEAATYAIYEVDEATSSNAVMLASFTKRFPETRPTATAVAPKDGAPVYTAAPTFTFSVADTKATAYRLQIRPVGSTAMIYDSGAKLLPGRVGTTVGASACEVTPPIYAEVPVYTGITTNRQVFADYTNYQWRVALYDAKYNTTSDDSDNSSDWSAWADFEMDVRNRHRYPDITTGCGTAALAVRYFGPKEMNPTNIIIEAYPNADFRGQALAQMRLADLNQLRDADDIETSNAVLRGIPTGTIFFRAFYDQNDNGTRDSWETWGYANEVGRGLTAVYNPHPLTLTPSTADFLVGDKADLTIFLTDCDVNQNEYPDCMEPEKFPEDVAASDDESDFIDWWEWAEADPTDVTDGSVMAYHEAELYEVTLWDGVDSTQLYRYLLELEDGQKVPVSGSSAKGLKLVTCYEYSDTTVGYGLPLATNGLEKLQVYGSPNTVKVVYVHSQVREKFGFSANTAVPGGTENTKAFTAQDKYLVLRYLENTGRISDELIAIATAANKSSFEQYVYESGNETLFAKYTLRPALVDSDFDGIPDGWELYIDSKPLDATDRNADAVADGWDGDGLGLWQEYDACIERGTARPTDPRSIDTDVDGVTDKYAYMYHLKGGDAGEDFDNDGLSNYAEYLISEVFKYAKCDPDNDRTNGHCVDQFLKVGSLYLGEIFQDHDQMSDAWEDKYQQPVPGEGDKFYTSRYVYDAWQDYDKDGWSNYAEYRAGTDPSSSTALSIDGYTCPEYPLPAIEADVIYNGSDVITGPLVFKAWSEVDDYEMVKAPDAMWTLGTAIQSTTVEGTSASSATVQGSALQQHEKFLGHKPHGEKTFYLTGGNISEGTVKLLFLDKGYGIVTYDPLTDLYYPYSVGEPDKALWYYVIIDKGGKLVRTGSSLYKAMGYDEVVVGTVDYKTGRVTINFDHPELCGAMAGDPNEGQSGSSGNKNTDGGNDTENGKYHWLDLDESYVRIEWKATQAAMAATGLHYFCDPDPVSAEHKTLGHLREGKHSFVCFVDDDGNGEYTPGELFGFVRGVDVGWANAKFTIELTETHPIFGRVGFIDGANDRAVWYGSDSGNVTDMTYRASSEAVGDDSFSEGSPIDSSLSGGKIQRVRIDRYAVNGCRIGVGEGEIAVPDRVLVDKWINLNRPYLHEGDFMNESDFDIDWAHFKEDILDNSAVKTMFSGNVQSVTYRVVVDNEDFVHPGVSNRVLNVAFTRWFDANNARKTPTNLKAMLVQGARPTFRWSMDGLNTYTAFKLRIVSGDGKNTVIYESPMTRTPVLDKDGNYVWEAPFYVGDQTPQGKVLALAGNYKWTISMYNAKFQTDLYASPVDFVTSVNQQQEVDDHGFGQVKVAVKYAGPVKVLEDSENIAKASGKVRVQAFTTPDFSGTPAAQTFVTNKVAITNTLDNTPNVTLCGLPAGEYYIRAYIDSNGNFEKDDFESWGTPKQSVVIAKNQPAPIAGLYIEDADTDQDWIPDAWEYSKYHRLDHDNAKVSKNGEIVLKSTTYGEIINGEANFSRFLSGSSLTFFENFDAAALIPDLDQKQSDTATDTIAAIRNLIEKKVMSGTVKINSLVVDAANKTVIIEVGGEVADNIAGVLLAPIYSLAAPTTVTISIYEKSSLLVNEWTWVKDVKVDITDGLKQTIPVQIEDVDFNSGFYKVEVVQ